MNMTHAFGAGIMTDDSPPQGMVHDAASGEYAADVPAPEVLDIARFDCTVTMVSPKTGDHRTFRIKSHHKGSFAGKRTVELLVNGDGDYRAFGFVIPTSPTTAKVVVFKAFRGEEPEKASAHEMFGLMLANPGYWAAKGVTYAFARRCRRCGRELTRPDSIARGVGDECMKYE